MSTIKHLAAKDIAELRRRARKLSCPPENCPEGWSKRIHEPEQVLAIFDGLSLQPGFVLRAYQFANDGNGNGTVWALPEDADLPDPEDCQKVENLFLQPPRPPAAIDDFRDVIVGDGSPISYIMASLAARELREFGAMWHGVSWGAISVLDSDPWIQGGDVPVDLAGVLDREWSWDWPKPEDWRPRVDVDDNSARVTLIGYIGLAQHGIFQITDLFQIGSYAFEYQQRDLALGPHGWIP